MKSLTIYALTALFIFSYSITSYGYSKIENGKLAQTCPQDDGDGGGGSGEGYGGGE